MHTVHYIHNGIIYEAHESSYPAAIRNILSQIKNQFGSRPMIKQVVDNCTCWVSQ